MFIFVRFIRQDEMMYIFRRTPLGPQEVCGVLMGNECAKISSPLHNWTVAMTPFPKPPLEEPRTVKVSELDTAIYLE